MILINNTQAAVRATQDFRHAVSGASPQELQDLLIALQAVRSGSAPVQDVATTNAGVAAWYKANETLAGSLIGLLGDVLMIIVMVLLALHGEQPAEPAEPAVVVVPHELTDDDVQEMVRDEIARLRHDTSGSD